MKSFTKYFKVILCFMAFAVASFLFAFAPTLSSYAALQTSISGYNMAIKAVKMPRKAYVDEATGAQSLRVPLLQTGNSWQDTAKYTIRVIDPSFTAHDYNVDGANGSTNEADAGYFTKIKVNGATVVKSTDEGYDTAGGDEFVSINALNNGKYDIIYIMQEGDGEHVKHYYSNTYSITVENVSYSLDFSIQTEGASKGLKVLLPETVAKSSSDSAKIALPKANVKNSKSEECLENVTVAPKVFNDYGRELSEGEIFKKEGDTYYLCPTTEGKYTIEYTYAYGNNPPKKSFTIEVVDGFTKPTSSDLTIATPTMPSVELGQKEVKLPDVVVSNKTADNVEHNVVSIEISKGNISKKLTNNTFTFDMTKEFFDQASYTTAMLGDWSVRYTIQDAYGNEKSITMQLENVKDSTNPEVFMAYDYEVDATTGLPVNADKIDTTVATELKPQYGYNELYFPAIYAKDNVTAYNDFIFVRYIQSTRTDTIYYIDNVMVKDGERHVITAESDTELASQMNASGDTNIGSQNKAVKFDFNVEGDTEEEKNAKKSELAGEYKLGYYVLAKDITKQSSYLYSANTTMYTIEILPSQTREITTTVEHTVEINNIKDGLSIASDGTLSVNITANEKKRGESTTYADKRLKTAVFYYYTTTSTNVKEDIKTIFDSIKTDRATNNVYYGSEHIIDSEAFKTAMKAKFTGFEYAELKNKNNYELTLKDYQSSYGKQAHVIAISVDDDGNISLADKLLNIKDMNDVTAPAWTLLSGVGHEHSFTDTALEVKQGTVVELPDIAFTDDDKTLSMNVSYYVNTPINDLTGLDYKAPIGKNYKNVNGESIIYGGQIKTDIVGEYHVVYSATDDAGNTTYVYFTFKVTPDADPILKVSATGEDITVSGASSITGEIGMQVNFDAVLWSNDLTQNLTNESGVVIDYTVEDGGKKWSTGDDATSFIFSEQGDYYITFTASYESYSIESQKFTISVSRPDLEWNETLNEKDYNYAPKDSWVSLPDLSASQGDIKAKVELKVTFKGENQTVKKEIINGTTVWRFKTNATLTGDYKVEYTATTAYSSIKKSFTIKVGDNVPPVISMEHVADLEQDLIYDGKTSIEMKVYLVPTSTSSAERQLKITITNGSDVKTYDTKLKITDKDENGEVKEINWNSLTVELMNGSSTMSASTSNDQRYTKTYSISSTGDYKLVLKVTDSNSNTTTKEIKFTVKTETEVEKKNDTVVGVVLIVLSLVVLAGVILFFALTGKGKGGSSKSKSSKQVKTTKSVEENKVEESKVEVLEDTKVAEDVQTESEAQETEPKSGDVE